MSPQTDFPLVFEQLKVKCSSASRLSSKIKMDDTLLILGLSLFIMLAAGGVIFLSGRFEGECPHSL